MVGVEAEDELAPPLPSTSWWWSLLTGAEAIGPAPAAGCDAGRLEQ